jgi:tRNA A-37 threonylcarbamoyl transferase component Bud32
VQCPAIPADETERLSRLRSLDVLDTPAEGTFDNIARLAAQLCEAPIALISLVDEQRQWFKARVGFPLPQTSREQSFCGHTVAAGQVLIVPDAIADVRFHDNPLVTSDPNIRFYAAVPLQVGPGSALGTLCVMDRVPRQLTASQLASLQMLANQVVVELRLRKQLLAQRDTQVAAAPPELQGTQLEHRYQLEGTLGRGGMGFVVAARDLRSGEAVAIKFLHNEAEPRNESVVRFAREARAVMHLKSAHVARVHDVGNTEDGVPYIVMERLQGEELGAAIGRRGPLPIAESAGLLLQACEVLGEAHDAGIVHRDIKPSNLFLCSTRDAQGSPLPTLLKVLDFGIAKFAPHASGDLEADITGIQTVLGCPYYMAPEQLVGDPTIDARVDIWSLGVVLFEMLTGTVPFSGDTLRAVYSAVLTAKVADYRQLRPELPDPLVRLIGRCLQSDRAARPDSVGTLARELAAFA